MKRVLITGAGSYIGTNIENWLNRFPSKYQVASIGTINNEWKKTDFSSFDVVIDVIEGIWNSPFWILEQ